MSKYVIVITSGDKYIGECIYRRTGTYGGLFIAQDYQAALAELDVRSAYHHGYTFSPMPLTRRICKLLQKNVDAKVI